MSKNLKTLICCLLALVFVAGTVVAVFADTASTSASEEASSEVESATDVEDVTDVEADESTTAAEDESAT
ncbi:MAG: hypothetical protein LUH40_00215, partial [Clostridiales bacterium]|nr:hypothetical protein [Clostridiales bacterium]